MQQHVARTKDGEINARTGYGRDKQKKGPALLVGEYHITSPAATKDTHETAALVYPFSDGGLQKTSAGLGRQVEQTFSAQLKNSEWLVNA